MWVQLDKKKKNQEWFYEKKKILIHFPLIAFTVLKTNFWNVASLNKLYGLFFIKLSFQFNIIKSPLLYILLNDCVDKSIIELCWYKLLVYR